MSNLIVINSNYISRKNTLLDSAKPIGNIIDYKWYNYITTTTGRPDLSTISIFSDVVYWLRSKANGSTHPEPKYISNSAGNGWQTSYAYFIKKFGFSHETIRRALVKLERLGAIKREFRNVKIGGQIFNNILFIRLGHNIDKFLSSNRTDEAPFSLPYMYPYPHGRGDHIKNKIKESKNRSSKSSFVKSKFKQQEIEPKTPANDSSVADLTTEEAMNITPAVSESSQSNNNPNNKESLAVVASIPTSPAPSTLLKDLATKIINKVRGYRRKPMSEFYPISEEDAEVLRKQSGREFNLNYINQLLQKLSKAKPNHGFYTKGLFMKYMTMTLSCELRQTVNVNNEGFKFKAAGEGSMEAQEKYLQEIEYSSDTSCVGQLKRKIAAVFDSDIAYKILSNHSFALSGSANGEFEIRQITSKSRVEITALEQRILLEQVRAVYGAHIEKINNVSAITSSPASHSAGSQSSEVIVAKSSHLGVALGDPSSIWHKVSLKLLDHYGEAIHSSWFSRLNAQEDKLHKKLILKAPTNFISSWINDKYGYLIGDLLKEYKYSCVIC